MDREDQRLALFMHNKYPFCRMVFGCEVAGWNARLLPWL